jgi:SAM-dependent methyltransferase
MPIPDPARFFEAYDPAAQKPGAWDIPRAQSVFIERADDITGKVLDSGCGTGENALFFAERGRDVTGIDFVPAAIEEAGRRAEQRGLKARFLVKDALTLADWNEGMIDHPFDNIIDSAVFHVFSDEDMQRYVKGLAHVLKPGGRLFMIVFSDEEVSEGGPRRIPKQLIYDQFKDGWEVESIEAARIEMLPELAHGFTPGGPKAWFAVIKRV